MTNTLLCCDWGTSSLRLRWVDLHSRAVLAEIRSNEGVARTFTTWQAGAEPRLTVYRRVLSSHIARLSEQAGCSLAGVPLVLSGMASASIGMVELPYAGLPFAIDGSGGTAFRAMTHYIEQSTEFPHDILLISGVRSETDVMRGEETQLIGLSRLCRNELAGLRSASDEESTLIMPGTHSKHIDVRGGIVTGFRTYMTGELFALLNQHSILKDSVQPAAANGWDQAGFGWKAFRQGVQTGATSNLLNILFSVRTNQLFERYDKNRNHTYLSGLLIGSELASVNHPEPHRRANQPRLILCSGSHVFDHYQQAADELALSVTVVPADVMEQSAVAGQVAIFERTNRQINVPASLL